MRLVDVSARIYVPANVIDVNFGRRQDPFGVYRFDLVHGAVPDPLTVMNNGDSIFLFDACTDWARRAAG
jgi:hypothetical protein